jgi:hypothetical protein
MFDKEVIISSDKVSLLLAVRSLMFVSPTLYFSVLMISIPFTRLQRYLFSATELSPFLLQLAIKQVGHENHNTNTAMLGIEDFFHSSDGRMGYQYIKVVVIYRQLQG